MTHRLACPAAPPCTPGPRPTRPRVAVRPTTSPGAALSAAFLCAAALLAATPAARAQTNAAPSAPPAASGTATPPDIVKPRTAGPGDSTAGVIRPGPSGDPAIHVPTPSGTSFPTPVIRPQTMQGDTPVVPK